MINIDRSKLRRKLYQKGFEADVVELLLKLIRSEAVLYEKRYYWECSNCGEPYFGTDDILVYFEDDIEIKRYKNTNGG